MQSYSCRYYSDTSCSFNADTFSLNFMIMLSDYIVEIALLIFVLYYSINVFFLSDKIKECHLKDILSSVLLVAVLALKGLEPPDTSARFALTEPHSTTY